MTINRGISLITQHFKGKTFSRLHRIRRVAFYVTDGSSKTSTSHSFLEKYDHYSHHYLKGKPTISIHQKSHNSTRLERLTKTTKRKRYFCSFTQASCLVISTFMNGYLWGLKSIKSFKTTELPQFGDLKLCCWATKELTGCFPEG